MDGLITMLFRSIYDDEHSVSIDFIMMPYDAAAEGATVLF